MGLRPSQIPTRLSGASARQPNLNQSPSLVCPWSARTELDRRGGRYPDTPPLARRESRRRTPYRGEGRVFPLSGSDTQVSQRQRFLNPQGPVCRKAYPVRVSADEARTPNRNPRDDLGDLRCGGRTAAAQDPDRCPGITRLSSSAAATPMTTAFKTTWTCAPLSAI